MIEYVKLQHLKAGDVVSKSIYLIDGRLLIGKGRPITEKVIKMLSDMGYRGIYIENNSSVRRELVPVQDSLIKDEDVMEIAYILSKLFSSNQYFVDPYDIDFYKLRKELEIKLRAICQTLVSLEAKKELFYEIVDVRNKNDWLYFHCINTCILSTGMAIKYGVRGKDLEEFSLGCLLHDLGKSDVPKELLEKSKLSEEERITLRKHPTLMFRLLQHLEYSIPATYSVWQHHEYEDGTGYPNGLYGKNITTWGKILSLANVFDNMTHYIPYRDTILYPDEALERLYGDPRFDTEIVRLLNHMVAPYPIGSKILLSNEKKALVLKNNPAFPMRPLILIGSDLYDLAEQLRDVTIIKIVD